MKNFKTNELAGLHCLRCILLVMFTAAAFNMSVAQDIRAGLNARKQLPAFQDIERFYQWNDFRFAWVGKEALQAELKGMVERAAYSGLQPGDYQKHLSVGYAPGKSLLNYDDSVALDLAFTRAAIYFFTDIHIGKRPPSGYYGLKYHPVTTGVIESLVHAIKKERLISLPGKLQPETREFYSILQKQNFLVSRSAEENFRDARIRSSRVDTSNRPLVYRLYQLGFIDSVEQLSTTQKLAGKLAEAQRFFDLPADGILRNTSIAALNKPVKERIRELDIALNTLRWISQIRQDSLIILNIPSASLVFYRYNQVLLQSKVIVGKPSTPTPTLASTINSVIIYPYWHVPNSIATKELLPHIKRNPGYINAHNYQVLNKQGQVLDPYSINWNGLSSSYFPYIIRQGTGCDNALGILKFDFANPFSVYLHDTPSKSLFAYASRFFSHGCMRVEKPAELARLLLREDSSSVNEVLAKGPQHRQSPDVIRIRPVPLMVIYSTAWYTAEGEARIYRDVYNKNP